MTKIKTLKEQSGEIIYPLTSTKAVVDENGNTIEGRLVVADGEDLVTDGNVLRLKDRPNTDGMGYVILRKDKTFAEQVTKPNTIYEIRYDFDLNGAEITIPENCVLKFEGGKINNGILNYQSTITSVPEGDCLLKTSNSKFSNTIIPLSRIKSFKSVQKILIDKDVEVSIDNRDDNREFLYIKGENHKIIADKFSLTSKNVRAEDFHIIGRDISVELNFDTRSFYTGKTDFYRSFVDCHFENISINIRTNTSFERCTFTNCEIQVLYDDASELEDVKKSFNVTFEDCSFHIGDNNLNNKEALHIIWAGFNGSVKINKCRFYLTHRFDSSIGDWIDCYDSCNISITNNTFISTAAPGAEGIINIKSHSHKDAALDNIGEKYNVIVNNNTFCFDVTNVPEDILEQYRAVIWVRNEAREDYTESDVFYKRSNVSISNNLLTITDNNANRNIKKGSKFSLVRVWGFSNLSITGNLIKSNIGSVAVIAVDRVIDRLENIIISHNNLYTPNDKEIYGSLCFFYPNIEDKRDYFVNFCLINNCAHCATYRDTTHDSGMMPPSTAKYINNTIYDTRLKKTLSRDANVYNLDYNNKFNKIDFLYENKPLFQGEGYELFDALGNKYDVKYIGNKRPTEGMIKGFQFFDTTLNKPICWTGTEWVEGDGQAAGIKRAGTWSQRPNADGSFLDNGFQYFLLESEPDEDPDGNPIESITGNGKPIWWIQDGRKWVDATGATVTG